MVFALVKYCNSNLFYGDEGKRKLRISVLLFSVSTVPQSMENFCLSLITVVYNRICADVTFFSPDPPHLLRNFSFEPVTDQSGLQQPPTSYQEPAPSVHSQATVSREQDGRHIQKGQPVEWPLANTSSVLGTRSVSWLKTGYLEGVKNPPNLVLAGSVWHFGWA